MNNNCKTQVVSFILSMTVLGLTSCVGDELVEHSDNTMLIDNVPALFHLDCAGVVDLPSVSSDGEFALYGLTRCSANRVLVDFKSHARFQPNSNLLVWDDAPIEWRYHLHDYKIVACYPADATMTLAADGTPRFDGHVLVAETDWVSRDSDLTTELYLHFRATASESTKIRKHY